jgi:2,3,4,5-tetrahydropyridine-2-carboxylate N-succinyltransferase
LDALDCGRVRVAEVRDGQKVVNEWLKKAVLLSFRMFENQVMEDGCAGVPAYDKVPLKFDGWDKARFAEAGFPRRSRSCCPAFSLYCARAWC